MGTLMKDAVFDDDEAHWPKTQQERPGTGTGHDDAQEPKVRARAAVNALGTSGEDGMAEQAHGHDVGQVRVLSCKPLRCRYTQMLTEYSRNVAVGGITGKLGRWVGEPPPINTLVTVIDGTLNTSGKLRFHCALCSRSVSHSQRESSLLFLGCCIHLRSKGYLPPTLLSASSLAKQLMPAASTLPCNTPPPRCFN